MVCGLALLALTLRSGLALRRSRLGHSRRTREMRPRHLRSAKLTVAALLIGAVGGPVSWVWLRDGEPFETFHGWVGLAVATLIVITATLGRRLERGASRAFDAHALAGALLVLLAALSAMAGLILLP
jgi:cation transport ATPase